MDSYNYTFNFPLLTKQHQHGSALTVAPTPLLYCRRASTFTWLMGSRIQMHRMSGTRTLRCTMMSLWWTLEIWLLPQLMLRRRIVEFTWLRIGVQGMWLLQRSHGYLPNINQWLWHAPPTTSFIQLVLYPLWTRGKRNSPNNLTLMVNLSY